MNFFDSEDPIIACSTSNISNAAISIVRLSGFHDLSFLEDCFSLDYKSIKARFAHYGSLHSKSNKLDDIVLTYFKGPNSYNGENILELSVHGNVLNVNRIINFFINNKNFRRAYPGEFSYRALRNKKLNVSQVEGLDLLLNANSSFALEQGNSLLSGELKSSYNNLYKNFINHKSSLELSIDFLEDIGESESHRQLKDSFNSLYESLLSLYNRSLANSCNLVAPDICLLGNPNSGKSTFFNSLLKFDRAIVSNIQGTTRDFIKENILINEVRYSLIDTAGIRNTSDEIEHIGINKALSIFKDSFFKILLINPLNFSIDDFKFDFNTIDCFVFTHRDLIKDESLISSIKQKISSRFKSGSIEPDLDGPIGAKNFGPIEPVFFNLIANDPSEEEISSIEILVSEKFVNLSNTKPILIDRHVDVLRYIKLLLDDYRVVLDTESDISIISSELNIIGHCVSELIGIISPEEVLNNIFDNFCIGK